MRNAAVIVSLRILDVVQDENESTPVEWFKEDFIVHEE